ncbi:unnamed protein product [Acanthoscelides obtectus]|uniref:Uncharacterized protein n=1 Tax=Acanthoscelides obtectus TaxID=200917 RepID=A0A9P0LQ59_ACAOB|nr:unnamed protein product [Acanthoscelides obtectus]CAK1675027.1 H/ACA ribonucleoprotein complex non-core subunit NAF1 [Acanthoscelides obtectus]
MSDTIDASVDSKAQSVVIAVEQKAEMQASAENVEPEKPPVKTMVSIECNQESTDHKMHGSSNKVENRTIDQTTDPKLTEKMPQHLIENYHQQDECSNKDDANAANTVTEQKNIKDMEKLYTDNKPETQVIINKESHSLKNLMKYESSDSSSEDSEDDTSSSTDSSESSSNITGEVSDASHSDAEEVAALNRKNNTVTKGLTTTDILDPVDFSLLPDLKKLNINYVDEEFLLMGHVRAVILDTVVTVEALPGVPAYNLDTILFVKDSTGQHQPLGVVDDVIGQVEAPLYCLRFQTAEELAERGVTVRQEVYVAPKNDCTKYVFIKELMKIKGSDASWIGDKELPPELAEESDDEIECDMDESRKAPKRKSGSLPAPIKMNANDFNARSRGHPRRGFHRGPGHFQGQFHPRQNMYPPGFHEYVPMPNCISPAPFDPSQPPPMFPPPMHHSQGAWMPPLPPPPPPMGSPQFGPPMMGGPHHPPIGYGPRSYGPRPGGPGPFGPGPSRGPY